MLTHLTTLTRAAALLTLAVATVVPATSVEACHRGGGYRGGYGGGYARPAYVTPSYSPVQYTTQSAVAAPAQPTTPALVAQAKQMLKSRNYGAAQQAVDVALKREPKNAALMQLKSLISFAQSDFQAAAAMAYSALTLGQSFDWNVCRQLYPSTAEYTQQYQTLAAVVKAKPDQPHLQFLLAYHHLLLGHQKEGRAALELAKSLLPQDKLIPMLLSQLPSSPAKEAPAAPSVAVDDSAPMVK